VKTKRTKVTTRRLLRDGLETCAAVAHMRMEVLCVDIVVEAIRSLVQQEDQGYNQGSRVRMP
jgi:hypothetical protein